MISCRQPGGLWEEGREAEQIVNIISYCCLIVSQCSTTPVIRTGINQFCQNFQLCLVRSSTGRKCWDHFFPVWLFCKEEDVDCVKFISISQLFTCVRKFVAITTIPLVLTRNYKIESRAVHISIQRLLWKGKVEIRNITRKLEDREYFCWNVEIQWHCIIQCTN